MQSEIDVVVFVTRVWQVFLCLFLGIFLGICVAIIIFICWYKVFDKVSNSPIDMSTLYT